MNQFKKLDITINWVLSLFLTVVALLNLLIGKPELALLSFIPAIGLFPPLQPPPALRLVMLTIGALAVALS